MNFAFLSSFYVHFINVHLAKLETYVGRHKDLTHYHSSHVFSFLFVVVLFLEFKFLL